MNDALPCAVARGRGEQGGGGGGVSDAEHVVASVPAIALSQPDPYQDGDRVLSVLHLRLQHSGTCLTK